MKWQPIETAPKDGTRYLIFQPYGGGFDIYEACYVGGYESGNVWFSKGRDVYNPTHWMPLPPPPEE